MPDFSITTCGCPPAEAARAILGWGEGTGVGTAIALGGGAGVSDVPRAASTCASGVFRGLGVSSFCADFDFPVFFAVFGFGVGVWRSFVFGV